PASFSRDHSIAIVTLWHLDVLFSRKIRKSHFYTAYSGENDHLVRAMPITIYGHGDQAKERRRWTANHTVN
ncbi:MAG: hypothetical protein WAM60_09165, partial [Candidatus Promineifilaceae bacterium]